MKNKINSYNEIDIFFRKLPSVRTDRQIIIKNYMARFAPSKLCFYGHSIPSLRSIVNSDLKLYDLNFKDQFEVMTLNWNQKNSFDEMALSLFWLEKQKVENLFLVQKKLLTWSKKIDNWAHSDCFCGVLAKLVEYSLDKKNNFLKDSLKKMNQSQNPWYRRISIVGLIYYSRLREKVLPFRYVLDQNHNLIHDQHYYVQKGVGWVLRELYNVYPEQTLKYLKSNAHLIAPAGWYAATEKLKKKDKNLLLKIRKAK